MKKPHARRIGAVLLSALLCLSLLAGCSGTFDAAQLVKGTLDMLYLGKISQEYLDMVMDSKEDCLLHYEQGLFIENYYARAEAGEFDTMTEEEYETDWAEAIIAMVRTQVPDIGYLDSETISVQITADDDGVYSTSDNDFQRIDALILQY